jgi:hypothetical protein
MMLDRGNRERQFVWIRLSRAIVGLQMSPVELRNYNRDSAEMSQDAIWALGLYKCNSLGGFSAAVTRHSIEPTILEALVGKWTRRPQPPAMP